MSPIAGALGVLTADIAARSARLGRQAVVSEDLLERTGHLTLKPPGVWSANRSCRMVEAADGWIAVNLARPDDQTLLPAWLETEVGVDPWPVILTAVRERPWRDLIATARLLGLPISGVGEAAAAPAGTPLIHMTSGMRADRGKPLKVVDMSAMWAGPLCGAVFASGGAEVNKVESLGRPDPVRLATPVLFERLNGAKSHSAIDFAARPAIDRLRDEMASADVVITSARPRAFDQLGLAPSVLFAANPALVWVAVSAYGWQGEAADWVGFGDDTAAAAGLVRWTKRRAPRFLGDALADPITGLAAAAGALAALEQGGGFLVDAGLAPSAARAAALRRTMAA